MTPLEAGEARWYALHTRSRHEKRVAAHLEERGLTVFLPLLRELHRWSDRRRLVEVPLFPGYVFVRTVSCAEVRILLLRTAGVASLVGAHGRGAPIPDKEIEDVQTLVNHRIPLAPYPFLDVGQRVRIRGGSLDGMEGILAARNADRSLVVSVELIRRSVAIRLAGYDVEAL
jgi:transcription termination/antitermination protein NusG